MEEFLRMAKIKDQSCSDTNDLADLFCDAFQSLLGSQENPDDSRLLEGREFLEDDKYYYLRLSECFKVMSDAGLSLCSKHWFDRIT